MMKRINFDLVTLGNRKTQLNTCIKAASRVFLNGAPIDEDTKSCHHCKRPCKFCIPVITVDCSTHCDMSSSRTIATDTSDLSPEDIKMIKREGKESDLDDLSNIDEGSENYATVGGDDASDKTEENDFPVEKDLRLFTETTDSIDDESSEVRTMPLLENINVPTKGMKKYVCGLCPKTFRNARGLKDHEPVHTGAKDYICDICKKGYSTRANLLIHKRTHEGKKTFSCSVCCKSFHKKDTLKVHFRNHTGERPFACDQCPMSFIRKCILDNHKLSHEAIKRFICAICGKRFSTISGLKYHEKSHSAPTLKKERKQAAKPNASDAKSVLCQLCGKIYSNMSNFRSHELAHKGEKPFTCQICYRAYAKKDSLRMHERRHSDLRLYPCTYCDYAAFRNGTLKSHLLRHTGRRPYSCSQCSQTFTQASSLSYHIKHHSRSSMRGLTQSEKNTVKDLPDQPIDVVTSGES